MALTPLPATNVSPSQQDPAALPPGIVPTQGQGLGSRSVLPQNLRIERPTTKALVDVNTPSPALDNTSSLISVNGKTYAPIAYLTRDSSSESSELVPPNGGLLRPELIASTGARRLDPAINQSIERTQQNLNNPSTTGTPSNPQPFFNSNYENLQNFAPTVAPASLDGSTTTTSNANSWALANTEFGRPEVQQRLAGLTSEVQQKFFKTYISDILGRNPNANQADVQWIVTRGLDAAERITPTSLSSSPSTVGQQQVNQEFQAIRQASIGGNILRLAGQIENLRNLPSNQVETARNAVQQLRHALFPRAEIYNWNIANLQSALTTIGSKATETVSLYSIDSQTGTVAQSSRNLSRSQIEQQLTDARGEYESVSRTVDGYGNYLSQASSASATNPQQPQADTSPLRQLNTANEQASAAFTQYQQGQPIEQVRGTLRQNEVALVLFDAKVIRQQLSQLPPATRDQEIEWNNWAAA